MSNNNDRVNNPSDKNKSTLTDDGNGDEKETENRLKKQTDVEEPDTIGDELLHVKPISGLYETWFLDYASYVILERAVPDVYDGLKPVQRRILQAMKRLEDGRYNKVANIIGFTMQFHPHGDASIGDALVALGQKDLLIDTQGNWGNIYTGDSAAAPRYIEARLSKFALEVVFNPKTTEWKLSYDGRNKEPVHLPVKFPLLLAQGIEGIAVGLASKILPHNFNELIDACIAHLKGESFRLFPDFSTGGMVDCSRYNDGQQGGRIRSRARIKKLDKKTLIIGELPYGRTTTALIDSILSATDKGKIKIKKIDDNTAENVEILVHLPSGVSPDQTIDGLYAFTDCEVSISPNCCVIEKGKPQFISVSDALRKSVENTVDLLTLELRIRKNELEEDWHLSSLEKIFIENRIYNLIEKCETWDSIIETIDKGLDPFKKYLRREVTKEDIVHLTEIKIKRISRYDAFKADEHIKAVEEELKEIEHHLAHIIQYTIDYYLGIKEKYGKRRNRKTEIREFDVIEATKVVAANEKLYVNRKEGFVGMGLKKDEYVCECSDIDDIIVFLKDGRYMVSKVTDKAFVGKDIEYVGVFIKSDDRTIYNAIYQDGKSGPVYAKRFAVTGVTRDKEYYVSKGTPGSRLLYFTANPNGEAEVVKVIHKPRPRMKKPQFEFDFSTLAIKGRGSQGNIITKHPVFRVMLKESGISTLGGRDIWYDSAIQRLNDDERGVYLGEFSGDERIVAISRSGKLKLYTYDLSTHFEPGVILIEKYNPEKAYSVVYYDGEEQYYYVKRFQIEQTEKIVEFIGEHPDSRLEAIAHYPHPQIKITYGGRKKGQEEIVDLEEFIAVKGVKAHGKRLTTSKVEKLILLEPPNPQESEQKESIKNDNDSGNENKTSTKSGEFDMDDKGNQAGAETKNENGEQRSLFSSSK